MPIWAHLNTVDQYSGSSRNSARFVSKFAPKAHACEFRVTGSLHLNAMHLVVQCPVIANALIRLVNIMQARIEHACTRSNQNDAGGDSI